MIVGLGLDVCSIARARAALEEHPDAVMRRVLSDAEQAYCESSRDPAMTFAGRFAAKEAMLKALGAPSEVSLSDVVIRPAENGPPKVTLEGAGLKAAHALGVTRTWLSLSHDGDMAAAVVVLEAIEGEPPFCEWPTGAGKPP